MNPFVRAWSWLALDPHQRKGLRALQVCLGLMLLFRSATELRFAPYFLGPAGLGQGSSSQFAAPRIAPWLDRVYGSDLGVQLLVLVLGVAAAGIFLGYRTRFASALALLSFSFMEARLPELGDGGDNVMRIVLIYMLFALPSDKAVRRGSLEVWLHNIAILAIGLQIGVVYLTSGFLKATGEKWSNGTALYLISQVEWFSDPALRGIFINPFVSTLATYSTLFFQVWFPVAVLTRLKPLWLLVGLLFHVGIGVFMGLICFSLVMIGLELFLITDAEYAWLAARAAQLRTWASRRWQALSPFSARSEQT